MPQINQSALVAHSAAQMYRLVNDVDAYSEFLPGCVGSQILNQADTEMIASIAVSKAGISKTFVTRNTLFDNQRIQIQLVEGPFRQLVGSWIFTPLDEHACKVELQLEFEFASKFIELAFGKIFKELVGNMIQAFTIRAREVYRG